MALLKNMLVYFFTRTRTRSALLIGYVPIRLHLCSLVVCILDSFIPPSLVPVGITAVAHETAHVIGAVLRGRPGFAKLADCARTNVYGSGSTKKSRWAYSSVSRCTDSDTVRWHLWNTTAVVVDVRCCCYKI